MQKTINEACIGIVIPCYNEAHRLNIDLFTHFQAQQPNVYYLFVDDGSKDETLRILTHYEGQYRDKVRVLSLEENQGKAEATRRGLLLCSTWNAFDYVGYLDADLATPLSEVLFLTSFFQKHENLLVSFGSRRQEVGNRIERRFSRYFSGRIIAFAIEMMFRLRIYDTQCGAKVFKASIIDKVFHEPFVCTWIFDVEVFIRLRKFVQAQQGEWNESFKENTLHEWVDVNDSKVPISYMFLLGKELVKLRKRYF